MDKPLPSVQAPQAEGQGAKATNDESLIITGLQMIMSMQAHNQILISTERGPNTSQDLDLSI